MDIQHIQEALEKIEEAKELLQEALEAIGHGDEASVARDMTRHYFSHLLGQILHETYTCFAGVTICGQSLYTTFEVSPYVARDVVDSSGRRVCSIKADFDDPTLVRIWFPQESVERVIVINGESYKHQDRLIFSACYEAKMEQPCSLRFFPTSVGENETATAVLPLRCA